MLFSWQALLWAIQSSSFAVAQANALPALPDTSSHVYLNTSSSSTKLQDSPWQLETAVSSAPISRGVISRSIISKSTETTSNSTNSGHIRTVVLPPLTSTPATATAASDLVGTTGIYVATSVDGGGTSTGGKLPTTTSTSLSDTKTSTWISIPSQYTTTGKTATSSWANTTTYRNTSTTAPPYITSNTTVYTPTITQNSTTTAPCITLGIGEPSTVWEFVPNPSTTTITVYANATNVLTYSTIPEFTPPSYCPTTIGMTTSSTFETAKSTTAVLFTTNPSFPPISTLPPPPPEPFTTRPFGTSEGFGASSRPVTTSIITSKNPTTQFTTVGLINYPGQVTDKLKPTDVNWEPVGPPVGFTATPIEISTVNPPPTPPAQLPGNNPPVINPPPNNPRPGDSGNNPGSPGAGPNPGSGNNRPGNVAVTETIGGVPVVVEPTKVIIGNLVVPVPTGNSAGGSNGGGGGSGSNGSGSNNNNPSNGGNGVTTDPSGNKIVVQDGQTFTVNPSQVVGPGGTTINIPPLSPTIGGQFRESPEPTIIAGVPVQVGHSIAVISGITYSIGAGASPTTITVNGQTISIGPNGLGFASTTVAPKPGLPTNVVVIGGRVFSAIGPSIAVIDMSTITYGGTIPTKTNTFNGATITLAPFGILYGSSSLGGTANPKNTQIGVAGGLTISEVGSTLAVISGVTLTVGPAATPYVTVIDGNTITAGPSGLVLASTTLSYPFNPTTRPVTAGGITYSEIGPSLVDIGGRTFTVGPGAKTTTDVFGGQTISIGPGGVGFSTTIIPPGGASATATGKKNGAGRMGSGFGVLGTCIGLFMGFLI